MVKGALAFVKSGYDINITGWRKYRSEHPRSAVCLNGRMSEGVTRLLAFVRDPDPVMPKSAPMEIPAKSRLSKRHLDDIDGFVLWMHQERDYSEHTVYSLIDTMKQFYGYFDRFTNDNCRKFIDILRAKGLKSSTLNSRLAALNIYSKYVRKPIFIRPVKMPKRMSVENVLTENEYDKLISFLLGYRKKEYYYYVRVLSLTGARISEFLQMTWEDILRGEVTLRGKGNKDRRFFFPKALQKEVAEFVKAEKKSGLIAPVTARAIREALHLMAVKAGVPKEKTHPHAFRHFFAKMYLKKNKDITMLADLLGHSNLDTTRIYLQKSYDEQKRDFDRNVTW